MNAKLGLLKKGARLLGIAESGVEGVSYTVLGGVVIRADLIIDGIVIGKATITGQDATASIIKMLQALDRNDLNGIILHGSIIAGYNIIDLPKLHQVSSLPVISVTKEPQEDLKEHLVSTFPMSWEERWKLAIRNGPIHSITLETDVTSYVQFIGTKWKVVKEILKRLTCFGGVPEPIRVARLLARAIARNQQKT